MINQNTGYTVGQGWENGHIAMLKTENSGDNWNKVTLPAIFVSLNDIKFKDGTNGIAVGRNINTSKILILYSIDGNTWQEAQTPAIDAILETVTFSNNITAFAVGTNWTTEVPYVLRSTDGGATWTELSHTVTTGSFIDIDFVTPNLGWASGSNGDDLLFLQTSDAGETWNILDILESPGRFNNDLPPSSTRL